MVERDFAEDFIAAYRQRLVDEDVLAYTFFAAMCNVDWVHRDSVQPADVENSWGATWREAARIVADARGKGEEYTDFYSRGACSPGEVRRGTVAPEIAELATRLGWEPRFPLG